MFKKIVWLVPTVSDLFNNYLSIAKENEIPLITYPYNDRCTEIGFQKFCGELKRICDNADLLIITLWSGSHVLSPTLIREIKAEAFVVLFSFDDEIYSTHQSVNYVSILDMVVSNDYFGKGIFDQLGVKTIYYPFHRFLDRTINQNYEKSIDISFVGNINVADRFEYINALNNAGFNVELFGKGTKNGFLSREKYISTICKSKINLNFTKVLLSNSMKFNEPWREQSRQIKGRPFEVFSLRSFCLSEWTPSAEFVFGNKFQTLQFFDNEDLIEKVAYYLKKEKEREEITNYFNKLYLEKFSYPESIFNLFLDIYSKLNTLKRVQPKRVIKPSIFYLQRANITYFNISLNLLKKGKLQKSLFTFLSLFDFKIFIYSAITYPYTLLLKFLDSK